MIEFEAKLKRWGRSFGIVVPIEAVRQAEVKENEPMRITLGKKRNPLKKHFGTLKFKKSTEELSRESDKEGWDE